jgi:SAM-dependent methyltransferase
LSDAVDSAFDATKMAENIHIVQGDICHLPFARIFDYAFSIGVLDHVGNPAKGLSSVAAKIKPGGHLSVWIYGAENNRWITGFVDPVRRRFTSRVNPRTLLHLSKLPTAVLYILTKLIYGPLGRIADGRLSRRLFYGDYLSSISDFGWREQHTIVFDHLVAPTAHYITRAEFETWWADIEAQDVVIGWHNKNSWRGFGRLYSS